MSKYLFKSKEEFAKLQLDQTSVKPCSIDEVSKLEANLNIKLPDAYKEYLLWMGHHSAPLYVGTDVSYKSLQNLQRWARDLLMENDFPEGLPNTSFVFAMHQGYQFWFFCGSEGEDPPVYGYNEGSTSKYFDKLYNSFSSFMLSEVNQLSNLPRHILEQLVE